MFWLRNKKINLLVCTLNNLRPGPVSPLFTDKFIAVTFLNFVFLCQNTMFKMLFRIANWEDPVQADMGLSSLSRPFGLTTSV